MPSRASLPLRSCRLGRVEYTATARLQRSLRAAREAGAMHDTLLLLQHDPVITCGTRTGFEEIVMARSTEVPLVPVERGGKATYHGPGQIVAYPIFGIGIVDGDVKQLVWRLEDAIIATLDRNGVVGSRRAGLPGVWIDADADQPRKIASVGLRLTRGVTFHGIALNVACDLEPFGWFTPCGIPDAEMTSIVREIGIDSADASRCNSLVRTVERDLEQAIVERFHGDATVIDSAVVYDIAAQYPTPEPALTLPSAPVGVHA